MPGGIKVKPSLVSSVPAAPRAKFLHGTFPPAPSIPKLKPPKSTREYGKATPSTLPLGMPQ